MLSIDIIIPVYKPGKQLRELLLKLRAQTVYPGKVLLVNTEKEFFDRSLIADLPEVEVIHVLKCEFDHGGTRHMAASRLSGEFILFMTQDAIPENEHVIEELVKPFMDENVAASYARQLPKENCSAMEAYTRQFNYGPKSIVKTKKDLSTLGIKTFFCSNVCAMYRRKDYELLGGFERHTIFNEDMIFAGRLIQAGKAVAYCAKARVLHSHNYTGLQQLKRNFDLGVSQADHPEIFKMAKSESEGIRMVVHTMGHLSKIGKKRQIPRLIWQSGCKYTGYQLGKHYKKLPDGLIDLCTMNRDYWK